jgi:hypothetical protein
MACYGDTFNFLYVDDVRTSQETHLWASTSCYGDTLTILYVDDVVPHKKHIYGLPRPVTGIALLFIFIRCSYLTRNNLIGLHGLLGDNFT